MTNYKVNLSVIAMKLVIKICTAFSADLYNKCEFKKAGC